MPRSPILTLTRWTLRRFGIDLDAALALDFTDHDLDRVAALIAESWGLA